MVKTLYYAVNGSGQGCIFVTPPQRDDYFKVWKGVQIGCYTSVCMQMESERLLSLPPLRWNDEPVMLSLELNVLSPSYE